MEEIMKRLVLVLIFLMAVPTTLAQEEEPAADSIMIAYGDEASGEITNREFEQVFTFEGSAGDVVQITMNANEGLDAYLYLTTLDNEIIARNDDYNGLSSRILARLTDNATYQIVATRLGDRSGSSTGSYTLSLEQIPVQEGEVTFEGSADHQNASSHVYIPTTSGLYTLTYRIVRGDYYPALEVEQHTEDYSYSENLASIGGIGMTQASITLELTADTLYSFTLNDGSYYSDSDDSTLYTVTVTPEEP
jgi:hypothetical protein